MAQMTDFVHKEITLPSKEIRCVLQHQNVSGRDEMEVPNHAQ